MLLGHRLPRPGPRFRLGQDATAGDRGERDLALRLALVARVNLSVVDSVELLHLAEGLVVDLDVVVGDGVDLVGLGSLSRRDYLGLLDVWEVRGLEAVLLESIKHTLLL